MDPKVGGSSPTQVKTFCLKNFDTFTWTSVHVLKMNAVARAQLTFQMLTLLQNYTFFKAVEHIKCFIDEEPERGTLKLTWLCLKINLTLC